MVLLYERRDAVGIYWSMLCYKYFWTYLYKGADSRHDSYPRLARGGNNMPLFLSRKSMKDLP